MAYNATPFHGKVCRVEKNGTLMVYDKGWNLSVSLDMADSSYAGQTWKFALPGQAGWTGSFECHAVMGDATQIAFYNNIVTAAPGTKLTDIHFNLDTTANHFQGDIFVTGVSINATMGGVVSATVNFQGNGALALADA
jgi:hypothetical protein